MVCAWWGWRAGRGAEGTFGGRGVGGVKRQEGKGEGRRRGRGWMW